MPDALPPAPPAGPGVPDARLVEQVAERVWRLLRADLRLELARGGRRPRGE